MKRMKSFVTILLLLALSSALILTACEQVGKNKRNGTLSDETDPSDDHQRDQSPVHNYGEWAVNLEKSCTESGKRHRVCSDCGDVQTEVIPSTGHTFDENNICKECHAEASKGLQFTSNGDGTCSVTGIGICTDANVIIPLTSPEGDTVTEIASNAFAKCNSLTGVMISGNVTKIGSYAFQQCKNLTSAVILGKLTEIEKDMFYNCGKLKDVTLPCGLTSIGTFAFHSCGALEEIAIPESVSSIGDYAFQNCKSLKSIAIPEGVTRIGNQLFHNCDSLETISIPESLTNVGESAFLSCWKLKYNEYKGGYYLGCESNPYVVLVKVKDNHVDSFTIHEQTKVLYDNIFSTCYNLQSIRIPKNVTGISSAGIFGHSLIQTVSVDKENPVYHSAGDCIIETASKTLVAGGRFCTIPDDGSVTSIGKSAFNGCIYLLPITIPNSVTSIGDAAFFGCSSLTEITIPYGITSIGGSTFGDCSSLKKITIPDSVTSIEQAGLAGCTGLTSITFQGTKAQWNAISKGAYWNHDTGDYTITCTDGTIPK